MYVAAFLTLMREQLGRGIDGRLPIDCALALLYKSASMEFFQKLFLRLSLSRGMERELVKIRLD